MDHLDGHDSDDMKVGASSDGASRLRKKRSKVWDEYKPILVNGAIQSAECRYCHIHMSCKGADGQSNGTSHLWRHQKICRAKEGLGLIQQQQDTDFPYVVNDVDPVDQILPDSLDDINLLTHSESSKFRSKVWKDFIPFYVEGRIQGADCVHCHKRLSAEKGRSHLNRHTQTCPVRGGTSVNHQKGVLFQSSVPSLKSRFQDELSPALTNGRVQIAEYASKFLKTSSGDRSPMDHHVLALPAMDGMNPTEQNTSSAQTAPNISRKFDQEASYQELTRMIVLHGYPLSIVEHEEMRRFAKSLNPAFNMASSIDIEEYSTLLFQKEKSELKEKIALLPHRVSLSASVWVHGAEASVKYLCLAVHFIDSDWKLQRRIIKFGVFSSSPTSLERMIHFKEACALDSDSGPFNVIQEAIRDWNLDQKHFSLTSVSEIRNDESTSKLMDLLIQRKCLPVRGELYNIACVDDVLNSIISKGQPVLHLVGDILERFIKEHMSSSLTRQQLLEVVTHMGLKCPQEDAKWWHKIYFRLEVFLQFKKAFPSEELLSAEDTKTVESVCKILRAFYRAVEVISGSACPTANTYFNELWKVRATLQEEASTDHTELANMVWEMQEAFSEYWQNSYMWLSIPVVLDPRFKITFIEFRLKRAFGTDADKYVSAIRDTIRELFHEYCGPVDKPGVDISNRETRDVELDGFDSDSLEDWDEHLNAQTRSQLLTELDNYLEDGLVPRKDDFDILNWWMSNSTKYPTLSIMARDVLAMPASAVHFEAALSSEGPVIHKQWSTLNIKTIEALVCTRDWIK
ncbi:zinc finger BED domain-containing protein RICESLEEPER 2-like isoform X2 [Phragmites australis]|uniref:zinc finger BED domain-containing protein RICESLEEPER 2-like isoform X2 n=1 Tax=Phragmites australis TaxID=29695 RepID=UPI002D7946C7|nr:zinc finger BED domain-containing protein RICESLEEPER 2-like isoform X2 [Phragmites australis]